MCACMCVWKCYFAKNTRREAGKLSSIPVCVVFSLKLSLYPPHHLFLFLLRLTVLCEKREEQQINLYLFLSPSKYSFNPPAQGNNTQNVRRKIRAPMRRLPPR